MRKVTDFIVNKRNIILGLFIILTGICLILSHNVNINYDITKYLPDDSETKIGKDIMDAEFKEQKKSYLNVMFKGLNKDEKTDVHKKLSSIKGVSNVDYDATNEYNKGAYTLYIVNVDDYDHSKTAENVYKEVKHNFKVEAMSGSIYTEYKPVLQVWIIFVAISMAMIILTILSESYIEPWLYLTSIGIAVFINKGTNIMFSSVSNITNSIVAILQLALSMDYSIMLSNRYRQEREKTTDKKKAMKNALYESFSAISSSSITTVVGLLALVFMSFKIGRDLGFVLAKGVLLSLVCIFFCLPGLLLLFDKQIINSKKKTIKFNLEKLGKYSYKTRWVQLVFIIVCFIVAFLLKGNLHIVYTGSEQDKVGKKFPTTNQIAIVYENKYDDLITNYCKKIEQDKKANQVLCYGNTINEKLSYNELNNKLKDLDQDTEIDDYLIKIIYYNYYNKNNHDSMTLNQFIKFIKSDVYKNKQVSSSIDKDVKDNINLLKNFANKENVTTKRPSKDIAHILGMKESDVKDILILYNSQNKNNKMTIEEFVNFILNDVSKDKNYGSSIDKNTIASLNKLKPFINKNTITKKMHSDEIAKTFGIDKTLVEKLFLFYKTTLNTDKGMTINEFSTFALSLQNDENFKNMFDSETIKNLTLLNILSDEEFINKELSSNELAKTLTKLGLNSLNDSNLNLLYFYKYYLNNINNGKYITNTKLSLNEFVNSIINDNKINSLIPSSINSYKAILNTFTNKTFIESELNRVEMYNVLKNFGISENDINLIYANIYKTINPASTDEEALNNLVVKITPYRCLSIIKSNLTSGTDTYNKINMLINIMDLSYNQTYNIVPTYDYETLANYLKIFSNDINSQTISLAYGYYDYKNSNDNNLKTMSIKELINFIIANKDDTLISSRLDNNIDTLLLGYKIVNNTSNRYSYKEMSNIIGKSEDIIKKLYNVADYNSLYISMTPQEFINLILNNQNNDLLKGKLDKNTLSTLNLVNKVMNSTMNNTKYNASELAKLLGSKKDTVSLVMSLYNSKNKKETTKISLLDFTNFILSDVITDKKYASKINKQSKTKLRAVNGLMKNTMNNTKYNSIELYNALSKLSDDIDFELIDLVYIYHGSENHFDKKWKLTVEEIINYLNDDILTDTKYNSFIDKEMTDKIKDAQDSIKDAKELLVTDKYSRMIINSKYGLEDKDTLKFIENAKKEIGSHDGIYIIGDSAMALEMSKSFKGELDFITILTMIFIFVVVAVTFRDLLVPLILVLIIQCAVYITMAILTLTGSNVYFIALLIVQAILMGATIDYAIVYTTYYKESRKTMDVKSSVINAYNKSIHTIISSSSILIIVTLIVSLFAEEIAAKICETVSEGTLCSAILILLVLPGVLSAFDKFICRKNYKK